MGQGLISFINNSVTLVQTNSSGAGGSTGNTSPSLNGFTYGLFIASPTLSSLAPTDLLTATWTFTGVYATNTSTEGRLLGGINIETPVWDNVSNSFVVVGWSANIAMTDWNMVASQLSGASFNNGVWSGPNWSPSCSGGFFGVSTIGYGVAPDLSRGLPGFDLFGNGIPNALGVPISSGWDLFVVNTPEPGPIALAGIGMATGIALHRRRNLIRKL